jgi:hypothetical protein
VGTEFPTSSPPVPHQSPTGGACSGSGSGRVEGEEGNGSAFAVTEIHEPEPSPRKRVVREKTGGESKHPHFVEPYRSQVFDAWKKLGAVNGGRLVNAIGPCFRPPEDAGYVPPEYVVMGVVDYCGLVPQGKGAPFAGPEDCAKRLMTLARNCERLDRVDPVARIDANFMAIHGHRMPGAGAA